MSLANGRTILAIPGPSVMPDRVLRAMHRAAPNIYEGPVFDMTESIKGDLAKLAGTTGKVALYIGNGHATWEASIANTMSRGDTVLVANTGRFAEGWGQSAEALGVNVETIDFGRHAPIDASRVEDALRADKNHKIKAVLAVQVDTATSVRNDIASLRQALDAAGHPALLMSDNMASMGCEAFDMDELGVDLTTAGSQKGLMTPPGVAILWMSEKALAARKSANCVTSYWDWEPRIAPKILSESWCGTAPTHHVYGLREALNMIAEEGKEAILARHKKLAQAIWAAVEAWGQGGEMELNIEDENHRSHAVTAIRMSAPNGLRLRQWTEQQAGVTLGIGLGMGTPEDPKSEGYFRIGHMGHVNPHMVLGTLGAIDGALKALEIPHGSGALEAASTIIAQP